MKKVVKTKDNTNTLFSFKYKQHFHNINDGALNETLTKHIIPCLNFHKDKKELNILDICFGLGYNTFATIYYVKKYNLNIKLNFYSPELDFDLIKSLKTFKYPNEFKQISYIIEKITKDFKYKDETININLFIGDARKYLKNLEKNFFHIIYQDAFSSEVNKELWTKEYFENIYKISKQDCIISTYSVATPVRLSLFEAGFFIYEYKPFNKKSSLCFKQKQNNFAKYVDMDLKKQRNKEATALYD